MNVKAPTKEDIFSITKNMAQGRHAEAQLEIDALKCHGQHPSYYQPLVSCMALLGSPSQSTLDAFIHDQAECWTSNELLEITWYLAGRLKASNASFYANLTHVTLQNLSQHAVDAGAIRVCKQALGTTLINFESQDFVFLELIVPLLEQTLENSDFEMMLSLESILAAHYIKPRESEEHFSNAWRTIKDILREGGRKYGALNKANDLSQRPSVTQRKRVAFLVANASMLAHVQVLCAAIEGYKNLEDQPFEPVIIALHGRKKQLEEFCQRLGIEIFHVDPRDDNEKVDIKSPMQVVSDLKKLICQQEVGALTFVSWCSWSVFMCAAKIAPKSIWWSLKFHDLYVPEIDEYVTGGWDLFREIHSRKWRAIKPGLPDLSDDSLRPQAIEIRKSLGSSNILMGTIARQEKFRNREFILAVCEVLKRNKRALYLWIGSDDDIVEGIFREQRVLEQTRKIGWVDTKLFAHVLDVFLDSFPNPCGFTLFQAMAAGVPAVLRRNDDSSLGLQNSLSQLYSGEEGTLTEKSRVADIFRKDSDKSFFPIVDSTENYVEKATALVRSQAYRTKSGLAGKMYVDEFMSNNRLMAESFRHHFSDIVDAKRAD